MIYGVLLTIFLFLYWVGCFMIGIGLAGYPE